MDEALSVPVPRRLPRRKLEIPHEGRVSGQRPEMHPEGSCATTETLYITSAEQKLWDQLVGVLSPALWEVKASGRLQGESGALSLVGSREAVPRAKEVISKLLIIVGSLAKLNQVALPQTEQRAAGFFHLSQGLDLFLWEGEATRFRADAVARISLKGDVDCGSAVFAQRVLSQQGSPCINFSVFLSRPHAAELGAGAMKLVLEAASQKGLQSLVLSFTDAFPSAYPAETLALGTEAFKKDHPTSPLKTIHLVSGDGDAAAAFHKGCEERWPAGTCYRDQLRNMLLSLEHVKTEVVSGYSAKEKTDVAVIPLVLESDGRGRGIRSLAVTHKILKIVPQAVNLQPGEILTVTSSAFPEFDCGKLYVVRLEGSQLRPEGALEQAVRKMVRSCLSALYGSFLESISFPLVEPADPALARRGRWVLIMLEEIDRFLKEFPNNWTKLVQVVHLPGQSTPCQVGDCVTTTIELVGACHPEDPLFLQYLQESPGAFHQFKRQLQEVGCGLQMHSSWGILTFRALSPSVELCDLGKAFRSLRGKYLLHCETRTDVMEALIEQLTLVDKFKSVRILFSNRMWFVGLCDQVASFLHCLFQAAFQRQVVSQTCLAEPPGRCALAKDALAGEMLRSDTAVTIEMITKSPPVVKFGGHRHRVEEAERRFKELLGGFQVLAVPLSDFQAHFVKAQWGSLFHNYFFLEQGIPSVLEISGGVQVAGLDVGKMKEAEELFLKEVCERTVEVAKEVRWATMCEDWKELLHGLECHKEVALHNTASTQVTVVGVRPHVTQVELSIREYLWGNSPVEEQITFDRPELVAAQQNLLRIMSWAHLRVSIQVVPDSRRLVLQVGGIRKSVQKAVPVIKKYLDSLVLDKMPLRKKSLRKYFLGSGAAVLQEMAVRQRCVATVRIVEGSGGAADGHGDGWQGSVKNHLVVIEALGRENHVALLQQDVMSFMAKFCERNLHNEAIATFRGRFLKELCSNTSHAFPIDLHRPKDNELQICGIQEDVESILEAIHARIEEYEAEQIEVAARQDVYLVAVKNITQHGKAMDQCLVQKVQRSSEEYRDAENFSRTGSSFTVLKVERIHYPWVSYRWKCSRMNKKSPEGAQDEWLIDHGTCLENWRSTQGIDFTSACRTRGLDGQGISFREDAVRSAFDAELDSSGHRLTFLDRALIGEYARGGERTKAGGRGQCNSLVDPLSKPALFRTFLDDHTCPEYLITFCGLPPSTAAARDGTGQD